MPDALAMRAAIDSGKVKNAVVIGAGLIGMEVVEALHRPGHPGIHRRPLRDAAAPDDGPGIRPSSGPSLRKRASTFSAERGLGDPGLPNGEIKSVKTDKREVPAEMVLMAVGVRPTSVSPGEAGLALGAAAVSSSTTTCAPATPTSTPAATV